MTGRLAPGQRLSERDLADELKVSRTPLRTALARLENDALVHRTSSGILEVVSLGPKQLGDLYATRTAIDVLAARLTAECATRDDLTALRQALEDAERAYVRGDAERVAEANRRFHGVLYAGSRNDWLERVLRAQETHFERMRYGLAHLPAAGPSFLAEHQAIYDAIASHDPAQGERAVREHIASVTARILSNKHVLLVTGG